MYKLKKQSIETRPKLGRLLEWNKDKIIYGPVWNEIILKLWKTAYANK